MRRSQKRSVKALLTAAILLPLGVLVPSAPAHAAGICPAVGQDSDCGIIITIDKTGAHVTSTGQPPFDGIEDTMVGVVNNTGLGIHALGLKSDAAIFGFDGDGLTSFGVAGNGKDGTGYGGPNAFFDNINAAQTAGDVNFITPIPKNGGTGFFALEDAVANATSCRDAVRRAVKTNPNGKNFDATFTPNQGLSLARAAKLCGFRTFDWVQWVTHMVDPSPYFARNTGGAFRPNVNGKVRLTSATTPFKDPPQGGGYQNHDNDPPDNSFPFYYDANSGELANHQVGGMVMTFHDAPADPCLPGGVLTNTPTCDNTAAPAGSHLSFKMRLAGVNFDGSPTNLGIGFTYDSTNSGLAGGVQATKTDAQADGDGTGGITITGEQDGTTYEFNGIGVTTVNGGPPGPAESDVVYSGPTAVAVGSTATLSAQLSDVDANPIAGDPVTVTLGTGAGAQSCTGTTDSAGNATCTVTVAQPLGPTQVTTSFAGDDSFLPATSSTTTVVYEPTSGGAFVVGDQSDGQLVGNPSVTFWDANWSTANHLSGGAAPDSFKGFEDSTATPQVGTTWTTRPGNSSGPPSSVPAYTAVIVSTSINKQGSTISGDTQHIVIVHTDPGYAGDPAHPGTGTIVAVLS